MARELQGPARTSQEASQDWDPDPADSRAFSSLLRTLPRAGRRERSGLKGPPFPRARAGGCPSPRRPRNRGGEAPGWRKAGPSASASCRGSGSRSPPAGHPLAGVPSHLSRCRLCGPGRMPLFISRAPLPFDSPLPSVSADLCVLGIQLEARTGRVTATLNPASAPPSTPGQSLRAMRGLLVMPGPARGFVGISGPGQGGASPQMGPEVLLVNVTSRGE